MERWTRRNVLKAAAAGGLAALVPPEILAACSSGQQGVLSAHQTALVTEATARLIPGPTDDPAEAGHPGAREAGVASYIATMLGALAYSPARVFAGGPFSDRAGSSTDDMASFLPLDAPAAAAWRIRLAEVHAAYVAGLGELDRRRFLALDAAGRDGVLASNFTVKGLPGDYSGFTDMLFAHAIEGMYSAPEYGGNAHGAAWRDLGFPGDVQPRGYTAEQVSSPVSTRHYVPTPAAEKLISVLKATQPPPVAGPRG